MQLRLNRQGLSRYAKLSYPIRYGRYHELICADAVYHLALDGVPKFLQGRGLVPSLKLSIPLLPPCGL